MVYTLFILFFALHFLIILKILTYKYSVIFAISSFKLAFILSVIADTDRLLLWLLLELFSFSLQVYATCLIQISMFTLSIHLADIFIECVCVFSDNQTHDLGVAGTMMYYRITIIKQGFIHSNQNSSLIGLQKSH